MVLGPHARGAFRCATVRKSYDVSLVHQGSVFCEKRDHLAVSPLVRLMIVRGTDEEEWPWTGLRLPAGPRTFPFAEASFDSEGGHQRVVEGERAIEVTDANEDV